MAIGNKDLMAAASDSLKARMEPKTNPKAAPKRTPEGRARGHADPKDNLISLEAERPAIEAAAALADGDEEKAAEAAAGDTTPAPKGKGK